MMPSFIAPTRYSKEALLKDAPIAQSTLSAFPVYTPETALTRLYEHDLLEISMVVAGSGVHRIMGQAIPCTAGDIYVVAAGVGHGYYLSDSTGEMTVRRIWFDPADWFDGSAAASGDPRYCFGVFRDNAATAYAMLNAETRSEVMALCDAIGRETYAKKSEWRDAVRAHLSLLLITLGRYVNGAIKSIPASAPKEWSTVSAALRMLNERFFESDLTLEAIAESLYISKSHLSRLFGRLTGESFSDYLRNLRLSHACALLRSTALPAKEIMCRCGLRDAPSFYKAFQGYTGMTPHQYRKSQHEQRNIGEHIMSILNEISENLQKGKAKIVRELVEKALAEGCAPADILNEGLLSGMNIIGEKFKNNEVYVPEVLVAARAMNMGTQVLKPHLVESGVTATGRVCIGTVQGDLHDIGKNLVRMMMESKGLEVVDLGVDVPAEKFVQTAIEQNCQVICCSALLTTTMTVMADVVKAAEAAGIRDKVKIMVGGAPLNEAYRAEIGADCYTADAASAADAAAAFCKA
ncbi:MAG: cobalamin-dependent protein [Clostridia bacterium]|nr:cobalamin-dependent protein [Clostridia bacterium]